MKIIFGKTIQYVLFLALCNILEYDKRIFIENDYLCTTQNLDVLLK